MKAYEDRVEDKREEFLPAQTLVSEAQRVMEHLTRTLCVYCATKVPLVCEHVAGQPYYHVARAEHDPSRLATCEASAVQDISYSLDRFRSDHLNEWRAAEKETRTEGEET